MDFEEWMDGIEANDYDDVICAMGDAFKAGQQSKQAEIDALQKRINDALSEIESGITGKHHIKRIVNILKGIEK